MYDITNSNTADRLKGFWLKKLDDMEIKKPIIVVGNKIDKVEELEELDIEPQRIFRVIKPLVKDYNVNLPNSIASWNGYWMLSPNKKRTQWCH